MGLMCVNLKAELFKMIQSVRGVDGASHTTKKSVKNNFLGRQALSKNLMLFSRGLYWFKDCVSSQYLTSTRCISLFLTLSSWIMCTSLLRCLGG